MHSGFHYCFIHSNVVGEYETTAGINETEAYRLRLAHVMALLMSEYPERRSENTICTLYVLWNRKTEWNGVRFVNNLQHPHFWK